MNEYTYVGCPYCGHSISKTKFEHTAFPIDPLEFLIYTKREQKSEKGYRRGRGRGHRGFYLIEGSGRNIRELLSGTPSEREIGKKIIERIKAIYASYKEGGLIE